MKNLFLTVALALVCLLGLDNFVAGRAFPGGGGRPDVRPAAVAAAVAIRNRNDASYGDYGGVVYNFNSGPTATGIGMQRGPSGSPYAHNLVNPGPSRVPNQGQADRDWWFQYQGQQMAAQRTQGYGSASFAAAGLGVDAAPAPPKVAMDVVKWPVLLQRPTFASRRAQIEAPYRRSPPGLSSPTAEDYRSIVRIAEEMKAMLEGLLQEGPLQTDQYNQADNFLNKLQKEAQQYAERLDASPKPKP
ncbi:MAG: hypothetical protein LLG00_10070 [Planctomycetaceae bacterium]|nr:hypothetical protein [Planctomycetaceae bacterium]